MNRLHPDKLHSLPSKVNTPRYNRDLLGTGIVHLGVGAFHRAHQAYYTEKVLNEQGGDWGIVGASLRSATVRDQLQTQDGLYTLVTKAGDEQNFQVVGAIKEVVVAPEAPDMLIAHLASPTTKVVCLTITEKGYCHDPATGHLQWSHSDIQQDLLRYKTKPVSAIAYLAASLAERREKGSCGVTLISCDNLPNNGQVLERVVKDFVERVDPSLVGWIEKNVTFPCTMVDRIVPATTDEDLHLVEQELGVCDYGAVVTEPFSQWVIEDKFSQSVPDWASAGALIVEDIAPYEEMKLRLLNGSHSIIAYLGFLAGYDYVHEVMEDDDFLQLICRYMDDQITPTLNIPQGFDIEDYKHQLRERFANCSLNHKTAQIAQDGSQKIPQRWIKSVRQLYREGMNCKLLALAVAGWVRYLDSIRDTGESFSVDDPMSEKFYDIKRNSADTNMVYRILSLGSVFGDLVDTCPGFVAKVDNFYHDLKLKGVKTVINEFLRR